MRSVIRKEMTKIAAFYTRYDHFAQNGRTNLTFILPFIYLEAIYISSTSAEQLVLLWKKG